MNRNPWELLIAFVLIAFSADIYWLISQKQPVTPTSYAGIILGVLGFLLMSKNRIGLHLEEETQGVPLGASVFLAEVPHYHGVAWPFSDSAPFRMEIPRRGGYGCSVVAACGSEWFDRPIHLHRDPTND